MKRGGRRATPGSFAGVIASYIGSDKFMRLAASTQGNYRRHLALAQSVLGDRPIEVVRPALVQAFLDGLSDRPATQKVAQTALKALERWAIVRDLLPRQITIGTDAPGGDSDNIAHTHIEPDLRRITIEYNFANAEDERDVRRSGVHDVGNLLRSRLGTFEVFAHENKLQACFWTSTQNRGGD